MSDHATHVPATQPVEDHPKPTGAYVRMSDPKQKIDMWGPRSANPAEGFLLSPPRKRKPWGLPDVGWAALYVFVVVQIALLPVLTLLAINKYHPDFSTNAGLAALPDYMTKVATTGPGLVVAMVFQWAAFVGVPLWATYRKGHRSIVKDFGVRFKARDLPLGLALATAMQLVSAGISWLLNQTSLDLSGADNTGLVTDQVGLSLVFMIVAATVGAPLTEELLFRGLILRAFLRKFARLDLAPPLPGVTDHFHPAQVSPRRRRIGVAAAVVLSAVCFGIMHTQAFTIGSGIVVAQTGLLGLVFAIVAVKTRRLGITICAHFFFNSASIVLTLLSTR